MGGKSRTGVSSFFKWSQYEQLPLWARAKAGPGRTVQDPEWRVGRCVSDAAVVPGWTAKLRCSCRVSPWLGAFGVLFVWSVLSIPLPPLPGVCSALNPAQGACKSSQHLPHGSCGAGKALSQAKAPPSPMARALQPPAPRVGVQSAPASAGTAWPDRCACTELIRSRLLMVQNFPSVLRIYNYMQLTAHLQRSLIGRHLPH